MKKILFAIMFLLSACSQNNSDTFKVGSYKMLNSMHNVPVMLSFAEDGSLNAKVVNIIMGQYELNGNNLIIIPSGTTMMMGPKKDMETEQNFIQSLLMVKSYKMQENNLVLEMENGSSMIFEPHNKPNE